MVLVDLSSLNRIVHLLLCYFQPYNRRQALDPLGGITCFLLVFNTVSLALLFDVAYSMVESATVMMLAQLFMVALWNRADHYIFILWFLLSFFSSPNLSRRRLDVCHTSTHGVALVQI